MTKLIVVPRLPANTSVWPLTAICFFYVQVLVRKFIDVRTRVAAEEKSETLNDKLKKKRTSAIGDSEVESLSESSDERTSDSQSDTEIEDKTPLVIGRNFTRS